MRVIIGCKFENIWKMVSLGARAEFMYCENQLPYIYIYIYACFFRLLSDRLL